MTGVTAGDDDEYSVRENPATGRFELTRSGELLFASFRNRGDAVVIPHVETLWAHRGRGYASRLMDGIVEILRADGRTMVPLCPFATGYMRDQPEHRDLLQSGR
ncbi:MAG: GNAT family N-acetyltransferase [Ilumatobacter sp.]